MYNCCYIRITQGYSSDGNAHNRAVLKNYLYVYKNYSVLESFAELARDYYLTDVKTVARPDLEVAALRGKDRAEDDNTTTSNEPCNNIVRSSHKIIYRRETITSIWNRFDILFL